jgi:hypothetical protein
MCRRRCALYDAFQHANKTGIRRGWERFHHCGRVPQHHAQALATAERSRDRPCRRHPSKFKSEPKLPNACPSAFAFLDTDHDGLVSVEEIAAQMQSVMRVTIPAEEIRSICKTSLSKNAKGLTMEDFKFLVPASVAFRNRFCAVTGDAFRCTGSPRCRRVRWSRTTRKRSRQVAAAAAAAAAAARGAKRT